MTGSLPRTEDLLGGPLAAESLSVQIAQQRAGGSQLPNTRELLGDSTKFQLPDTKSLLEGEPSPLYDVYKKALGLWHFVQGVAGYADLRGFGLPAPDAESQARFMSTVYEASQSKLDTRYLVKRAAEGVGQAAKTALKAGFPPAALLTDPSEVPQKPVTLGEIGHALRPDALVAGIGGLPIHIASSALGALTGMDAANDLHQKPPEERVQDIFDTAANAALFGTGAVVRGALTEGAIARRVRDIAAAQTPEEMIGAYRQAVTKTGGFGRSLITGAASGGAFGAVSGFGTPDLASKVFINGIMFAPIGAIHESMTKLGLSGDEVSTSVAKQASAIWKGRQFQITTKDSYLDVALKLEGLETSDNIVDALIKGRLVAHPERPIVIPGISPEKMGEVLTSQVAAQAAALTPTDAPIATEVPVVSSGNKVRQVFYKRPDGLFDLLASARQLSDRTVRSFTETGMVPHQMVEVNGTTYRFRSLAKDGKTVILQDVNTGRVIRKPRESVRPRPDLDTFEVTPSTIIDRLWQDVRRRIIDDAAQRQPSPATATGSPATEPTGTTVPDPNATVVFDKMIRQPAEDLSLLSDAELNRRVQSNPAHARSLEMGDMLSPNENDPVGAEWNRRAAAFTNLNEANDAAYRAGRPIAQTEYGTPLRTVLDWWNKLNPKEKLDAWRMAGFDGRTVGEAKDNLGKLGLAHDLLNRVIERAEVGRIGPPEGEPTPMELATRNAVYEDMWNKLLPHERMRVFGADEVTARRGYSDLTDDQRKGLQEHANAGMAAARRRREQEPPISRMRTETGVGVGIDANNPTMILAYGRNMYKSNLSMIVVKESVQNAIGAFLHDKGLLAGKAYVPKGGAKVKINLDPTMKSVTIEDNGLGMTQSIAENEFMDVTGTTKNAATGMGGFGLATVGILANAKHFLLETIADDPSKGGKRFKTTISGSSEDWANKRLQPRVEEVGKDVQTGTTLGVLFNDDVRADFYNAEDYVKNLVRFHKRPDITIEATQYNQPIGDARPPLVETSSPETLLVTDPMAHPIADIEFHKGEMRLLGDKFTDVHVMNNGVYQFTMREWFEGKEIPKEIIANIKSKVGVDNIDYPFTTSREQIKGPVETAMNKWVREMQRKAGQNESQALTGGLLNAPKIGNTQHLLIHTGLSDKTVKQFTSRAYATELADALKIITDHIGRGINEVFQGLNLPKFGGFQLENDSLGFNLDVDSINYAARQAGVPESPYKGRVIFHNPLLTLQEVLERAYRRNDWYTRPGQGGAIRPTTMEERARIVIDDLSNQTLGTIVHEVIHQIEEKHEEKFAGLITRVIGKASRTGLTVLKELDGIYERALREGLQNDLEAAKPEWTTSIYKRFTGHQKGDLPGDVEGGGQGQGKPELPTVGGTGSEQRRSGDAGTTGGSPRVEGQAVKTGTPFSTAGEMEGEVKGPDLSGPIDQEFLNSTPQSSFDDIITKYAKERGFSEKEKEVLKAEMTQRIHAEVLKSLPPEERAVIEAIQKETAGSILKPGAPASEQIRLAAEVTAQTVIDKANSNGMYVSEEPGNNLVLRDSLSDRVVGRFRTNTEAIEFIEKSAQAHGLDLDTGGLTPGRIGSGLPPIGGGAEPPPPGDHPYAVLPNNAFARLTDLVNTSWDWATPNRSIMTSLDSMFKTQFFAKIYDKLQVARLAANAAIRPWYHKLEALDKVALKMSKAEREVTQGWLETKSAAEVEATGGPNGTPLDRASIAIGRHIAALGVDLNRVIPYIKEVGKLEAEVQRGNISRADMDRTVTTMQQDTGMDRAHLEAAGLIQAVRQGKGGFFGPIAQLVMAIQNKSLSKAEYARLHNMKGNQFQLGHGLINLHRELAQVYGIPQDYRFEDLMAHARLYMKGDVASALSDFNVPPAVVDFYTALGETGELSAYEKDPVRAMQRYIKAGFDSRIMTPAVKEAFKALPEELEKVPPEARGKANMVVKRYINDVRGVPAQASNFTNVAVKYFLGKLGTNISVDVRQHIVNTILATGEAAFQGFRVIAGIRDFTQGVSWYFARFGLKRTIKMLEYGTKGLDGITKAELQAGGQIPDMSPIFFSAPTEFTGTTLGQTTSFLGRSARWMSQAGLKMSGQKDVYALLHAGSYLDTWKLAGEQLGKFKRGEITKNKAYDELIIDTYEPATVREFDRLVEANQVEEAARLLARETGREQVGVFGSGNNPGGWNRNIGRIAGQYGTWSMWARAQMMRMGARGSMKNVSAATIRFAGTQFAVWGMSALTGIQFANWYMPAGILFTGGPLLSTAEDVADAFQGRGYYQELAIRRLQRQLPYDPWHEQFNIGQLYIPGSYFAQDLHEAYKLAQEGDNFALPRAFGLRKAK